MMSAQKLKLNITITYKIVQKKAAYLGMHVTEHLQDLYA